MSELSRLEDTMPRGFVVGCSTVNVNVRRKAGVARTERAPRRMVGRRLCTEPGHAGCVKVVSPFPEE